MPQISQPHLNDQYFSHNPSQKKIDFFNSDLKNDSQILTIDSPTRKDMRIFKMSRTVDFKRLSINSINKKNNEVIKKGIWGHSATSMIREKSPSYKFPQNERFTSVQKDQRKNMLILKLNIVNQIASQKGIGFAKAQRKDHFAPKKQQQQFPSPATYYKSLIPSYCSSPKSTINPSTTCKNNNFNSSKPPSSRSKLFPTSSFSTSTQIHHKKGITIPKFTNQSKLFIHHGRNIPYQAEVTINNPGVGKYNVNYGEKKILQKKFKMGRMLKKFNEIVKCNPGPGAYFKDDLIEKQYQYQNQQPRCKSANCKGTFQLSKRTYLVEKNPEEYSPGPNFYRLKRFLEK